MRFLLDQDVYLITANFLRGQGHDVVCAADIKMSQSADVELLNFARQDGRIFVTRDRDFGAIAFVQTLGTGIIYLRMLPSTQQSVHAQLENILKRYSEKELVSAFVVVEADRYRIRR